MKSRLLLTAVVMSLFPQFGSAQTSPVAQRPAALKRLDFLEGRWKLTGWMTSEKGRNSFEGTSRCEWTSRFMMCRDDTPKPGEWPGFEVYSYNDRKGRYEGLFTDDRGQIGAHPMRWEGEKLISEYEYHVGGAYHLVRRTMAPKTDGAWRWMIEDLADDKVTVVIDFTATRLDK